MLWRFESKDDDFETGLNAIARSADEARSRLGERAAGFELTACLPYVDGPARVWEDGTAVAFTEN